MPRTLIVCALLAALPAPQAGAAPAPTETIVHLTVQPRAEPKPALRYQLLPELRELNPGNPVPDYMKCFMEQRNFFFSKESVADRDRWLAMPLRDLPIKELHGYGGIALRQADYAARLDNPDWQALLPLRRQGVHFLVPEVQQLRTLAWALQLRFRVEVAEGNFDDAVRTAKTLFALSRHLGEHPTLIGSLVGFAIANSTLPTLEEMIQQPGAPNLYWALTDLPSPLVSLRRGIQAERLMVDTECAGLDENEPMSEGQLKKLVAHLARTFHAMTAGPVPLPDGKEWLRTHAQNEEKVRAARKRLVESGLDAKRVEQFPALQVALLDAKRGYLAQVDEWAKWMELPYWQAEAGLSTFERSLSGDDKLYASILRSLGKVRKSQARLEQRLALLRHVEAVRLYAAGHGGKVPERLGDIPLPLPVDPFTGKPFLYEAKGQTAVIRGTPPHGDELNPSFNIRFVVTVKK